MTIPSEDLDTLRGRLEDRRRELFAWLAAMEHLDAGTMSMLADVELCIQAVETETMMVERGKL